MSRDNKEIGALPTWVPVITARGGGKGGDGQLWQQGITLLLVTRKGGGCQLQ